MIEWFSQHLGFAYAAYQLLLELTRHLLVMSRLVLSGSYVTFLSASLISARFVLSADARSWTTLASATLASV